MYDWNPDGSIGEFRTPNRFRKAIDDGAKKREYSDISVPVLSIFATPSPVEAQLKGDPHPDPEARIAVGKKYTMEMSFIKKYEAELKAAVPTAHILEWPGASHYLYLSNQSDVLREIHAFIKGLPYHPKATFFNPAILDGATQQLPRLIAYRICPAYLALLFPDARPSGQESLNTSLCD